MEKEYNDSLMPESFEEMAKAYSRSLKNKGFVFVKLEDEEFEMLVGEILVMFEKMRSCLFNLSSHIDSQKLLSRIDNFEEQLMTKYGKKKPHRFKCVVNKNLSFLTLVSIENVLLLKLMSLSTKSGDIELCNDIMVGVASVFAEAFSLEGFVPISCKDM
ncbi:MAG: hypothetical protein IJ817_02660 [Clostridia bacterium]|nr:hypothetical protein [Clostridia bacterium]